MQVPLNHLISFPLTDRNGDREGILPRQSFDCLRLILPRFVRKGTLGFGLRACPRLLLRTLKLVSHRFDIFLPPAVPPYNRRNFFPGKGFQ